MSKKPPIQEVDRSSVSGRSVKEGYATRYPHLTEHERIKRPDWK